MPNYEDDNIQFGDFSGVPQSDSMAWGKCDHCCHLHLLLKDEDDEPICEAVINIEQLRAMLKVMEGN